jgi:hypothetical protein
MGGYMPSDLRVCTSLHSYGSGRIECCGGTTGARTPASGAGRSALTLLPRARSGRVGNMIEVDLGSPDQSAYRLSMRINRGRDEHHRNATAPR